jgi:structure-specific recognition protein 1
MAMVLFLFQGSVYMEDMSGSEGEDNHDAYLERMKREGKLREEDDDDDDSSDVSFKPEGSGSDVAEE